MIAFALLGGGDELRAQPAAAAPPKAAKEKDAEKPAGRTQAVERAEPDILYVLDPDGKDYVPLINHTLDEIRRALLALDGGLTGAVRPRYRLKDLSATATIERDHAVLRIELEIEASDENWIRVPLRMGGIVLDRPAEIDGDGQQLLEYEAASHEHVAWFRGTTEKPRRVTLHGLAPLERQGGRSVLRINAPRALTSRLKLTVPVADAVAEVSKDSVLLETRRLEGATEFQATGLSGDFSIAWQRPDEVRTDTPPILSVDGQVIAQVDGRGIRTSAALRVNAFGREFGNFKVRLPRGATLLPDNSTEYTIAPVDNDGAAEQEPQVVEVRLKAKTSGPLLVKLVTDQGHDVTRGGSFELGGFEVLGAVRQYGYLAVQVKDDWQVTFGSRQGVQQSEDLPAEMPRDDVVAGFVYYGQPYSLPAKIIPLQTRTSVDPSFRLAVEPRQLLLDATFKYHVAGAKIFAIELDLAGWTLDATSLGPPGVVKTAGVVFGQGGSVLIPLQQAAAGEVELSFKARRPIPPDAQTVDVRFPRAVADSFGEGELVVVPDDNIVLGPHPEELVGLMAQPAPPTETEQAGNASQGEPRGIYRVDSPDAQFVADIRFAARTVSTRVKSRIDFASDAAKVTQDFYYSIAKEPADSVLLEAPAALPQAPPLVVMFNGKPLKTEELPAAPEENAGGTRLRVVLPEPRVGDFKLTATFTYHDEGIKEVLPLTTVRVAIPLLMPVDRCTSNDMTVLRPAGLHVEPLDKSWAPVDDAARPGEELRLTAANALPELSLAMRRDELEKPEALVIERAVVQTSLSEHVRQDRAVFRFSTSARKIALRLPTGAVGARFWLTTDRVRRRDITRDIAERADERAVDLPLARWYLLELAYEIPDRVVQQGREPLQLPQFVGQVVTVRGYWQLSLPPDEFLLSGPTGWTPEYSWQRRFLAWTRHPAIDRRKLEEWAGVPSDRVFAVTGANDYLFSTIEPFGTSEIHTVRRSLLVLAASGVVLTLGLIWLYWPVARRPIWLFAAGLATLSAAALWPNAALLWLQAASLGVLLVLVAVALERGFARPRRQALPYRGGSSSIVRSASSHTQPRPAPAMAPLSTETAAVVVESHLPETGP